MTTLRRVPSMVRRQIVSTDDPLLVLEGDQWVRRDPEVHHVTTGDRVVRVVRVFGVAVEAQCIEAIGYFDAEAFLEAMIERGIAQAYGVERPEGEVGQLFIRQPFAAQSVDGKQVTSGRYGAYILLRKRAA